MNDASKCLVVSPGYWRDIENFSGDCVLMVLASELYDENDYIRNYDEFINYVRAK
jgi:dTDP-4-dehydrorhamnose 3,5-epimerase-like enzyme